MAATKTTRTTEHRERGSRRLRDQPIAFLGLFLAPFGGLLTSWLIHAYTFGINWHVRSHAWVVPGNLAALTVTISLVSVGAIGIGFAAWHIAAHRKTPLRVMLTGSSSAIVFLFAISIGVGPHRWWSFAFVMLGWSVAGLWTLTRLNVTRQDPRTEEPKEDGVLAKLGLDRWALHVKDRVTDPATGEPIRTVVEARHAPGDTADKLFSAVPAFESLAGAPRGLSDAHGTDRADRSILTIQHRDELKYRLPYGPLSHPGGSIADGITFSIYQDGHPVWCYLAGDPLGGGFSPTGYGFMGMTRTGKTVGENEMLTEIESRCDVVIFYLNQAKGLQDIRPVIPGVEACVLAENSNDGGVQEYKAALEMVKRIITYRQAILARFAKSAWDPSCYSAPPTRRLSDGSVVTMEPMPALIVHVGEADSILERAGEIATYVSSKGLSTGVIPGYSLQRASAEFMPTGLRFNIGAWWCFGCGDEVSAGFALTDDVLQAGAHPEYWKQEKPGYHYFVGPGVPQERKAKMARTASGESRDQLQEEMLRRNLVSAPLMAKLDRGSAGATGAPGEPANRWDLLVRNTNRIRNELLGGTGPANPPANMTADDRNPSPQVEEYVSANPPANEGFTATEPEGRETAESVEFDVDFGDDVRETREVEGVELYPRNEDGGTDEAIDLSVPLREPAPDDDITYEEDKPDAPSREEGVRAFHEALRQLMIREDLRDPADPSGNTVIITPGLIHKLYPFRTRPWFSGELAALAAGEHTPPPSMALELAADLGLNSGKYRLRRIPDGDDE
jgi:hypothetical protein